MYPVTSVTLPADVFPIIASFIPPRAAPPTLRALALGNRRLYDIILPLLYSRLILRTEDAAITVFQTILRDPYLGRAVSELYMMSDLSDAARDGETPFDVLGGIQMLVAKRLLPRLHALGIQLLRGWHCDEEFQPIALPGRLLPDFWGNLRDACPRLRTLVLQNVGGVHTPWLSGTALDQLSSLLGLSTLRIEWRMDLEGLLAQDGVRLFKNLPRIAPSLHTLSLESECQDVKLVLCHDFPHLKHLSLQRFQSDDCDYVIGFLARHAQLESLSLRNCRGHWVSNDSEESRFDGRCFLPNLKHLKARFEDIRALLPVLPQLVSLSFTESFNCQVPYLLRALLPDGLPGLLSLEIEQAVAMEHWVEGTRWSEYEEGGFRVEKSKHQMARTFVTGYMHSIVRGAPNLEELGLHGMILTSASLRILAPDLSKLHDMKRFYYRGFTLDPQDPGTESESSDSDEYGDEFDDKYNDVKEEVAPTQAEFFASAEALARECMSLECVTSIGGWCLPYPAAMIERNAEGAVTGVRRCDGVGMLIPAYEDDPFPCNT